MIRIAPDSSESVFWHQGQAIAEAESRGILARAAFSHANWEYLVFDVEIFNETSDRCLVSPENFSLTTDQNVLIRAADPDKALFTMEMDASRREANAKNAALVGGIVLAAAAVVAATSSDGGDAATDGYVDDTYDAVDASLDVVEEAAMAAWGLSFYDDSVLSVPTNALPAIGSYDFWQNVALRRTTIMPNGSIRGLVVFPRASSTEGGIVLAVPLECGSFTFRFTQMNFRP